MSLSYCQLHSVVNPSFWNKLTELKLNVDKLNETERKIWGYFPLLRNKNVSLSLLEVDSTSFNTSYGYKNMYIPFDGKIINKNTIEQFKECNKMDLITSEGDCMYKDIISGAALSNPSKLNRFIILSFIDLKKFHYYYWFAFPVPNSLVIQKLDSKPILTVFSENVIQQLYSKFEELQDFEKAYFLVKKVEGSLCIHTLQLAMCDLNLDNYRDFYFAFFNISNEESFIGSQLRNYVVLILHHWPFLKGQNFEFLGLNCSRSGSQISLNTSFVYTFQLPNDISGSLSWVGWEKNEREKMGPRMANMKDTLDPKVLAENSVDLNLKLMKWRILPTINLEKVKQTKCLLLGSGTLGCSVARSLLAWGVRRITFVDNSTVSFSNPVRQSLFTYEDSVNMKIKAIAAAHNLRNIFPSVASKGFNLNIPMPGHSVGESLLQQTTEDVSTLTDLVKEHDIIFLLTDSRESRWLPTLLGSFYKKIVITAALGFDSYLVMRHGHKSSDAIPKNISSDYPMKIIEGDDLGCYFCNDVNAPGDSTKNRTLDQQCTVTRPGVSQIGGALAVELAVSILQHEQGSKAPAFYQNSKDLDPEMENQCVLGLVPHSIRGFLSSFNNILPATSKFPQCVACSEKILDHYEKDGLGFLLNVFNSSKYLEEVTGLSELLNEFDEEVLEFTDEDFN